MTGNDLTDSGLTLEQEDELRALLHRAAGRLEVATPSAEAAASALAGAARRPERAGGPSNRAGRRRWTVGAVAAAAVLVAGGTWFVAGTDDAQQVATGGPDDTDLGAPIAGDVWRWPESLPDGLQVSQALATSSWFGFQLAVDDPEAPTRWLGITTTGYQFPAVGNGVPVASGTLSNGATYAIFDPLPDSPTGATWATVEGPGRTGYLTVATLGVDHQAIIDVLADVVDHAPNLTDVESVNAALRNIALPEGLEPAWDPDHVGFDDAPDDPKDPSSLSYVFSDDAGEQPFGLSVQTARMTPAVASLDVQLMLDGSRRGGGNVGQTITRRDDLGTGTLVLEADGETSVYVFTADGVRLNASTLLGATTPPLDATALVDLLRDMRVTTESDVRARLRALGVDLTDASDVVEGRRDAANSASTTSIAEVGPTTTPATAGPTG